jgi:hypothetical protein
MGMPKKTVCFIVLCMLFASFGQAQKLTFAEVDRDDKGDVNFEIIGKLNGNFLVYKNARWKHKISVYNNEMKEIDLVNLDFLPEKTFNVDVVAYPDYFFMIYQYQKRNILHCMAIKMDAMAKKISEPIEIDTTQISFFSDNKIYNTVISENKENIVLFKLHKKNDNYTLGAKLFDKQLNLVGNVRKLMEYNDRRDTYDNFLVDNDGDFLFTRDIKEGNRSNSNKLSLHVINFAKEDFSEYKAALDKNYVDAISLKVDNLNKRYIINSFYYKKSRGNIEGIYSFVFNKKETQLSFQTFSPIYDSIRDLAKREGQLRYALDDFFIQQVIAKKDGGYITIAEDFNSQRIGNMGMNSWNRWDYLNSPYSSNGYYYNPYYGYYRSSGFSNTAITRYTYSNILINSFDKNGKEEWSTVFQKDQSEDDNENYLSFSAIPYNGEIHFLYNMDKRNQIIADNSINATGIVKRNPPLKTEQKGHQFMPRFAKQVAAKQFIMPCDYRGFLTFVKIDMP